MTVVRILDAIPESTAAGAAKAILGQARANVVWIHATAPTGFYDDPDMADLVWQLGDLVDEIRGRLARHDAPPTPPVPDQAVR